MVDGDMTCDPLIPKPPNEGCVRVGSDEIDYFNIICPPSCPFGHIETFDDPPYYSEHCCTKHPTNSPTRSPTTSPTKSPTGSPTGSPTKSPTMPTFVPTPFPTFRPTKENGTFAPTGVPTAIDQYFAILLALPVTELLKRVDTDEGIMAELRHIHRAYTTDTNGTVNEVDVARALVKIIAIRGTAHIETDSTIGAASTLLYSNVIADMNGTAEEEEMVERTIFSYIDAASVALRDTTVTESTYLRSEEQWRRMANLLARLDADLCEMFLESEADLTQYLNIISCAVQSAPDLELFCKFWYPVY